MLILISGTGFCHVLAIIVLFGVCSRAGQITTFKVRTEEVRIDMLITDHGKPVTGLQRADFEVFDNGVPQEIEFLGFRQTPIDAILVVDMSASVAGETLTNLINAGHQFLGALRKDERVALITFSDIISLRSPLSNNVERLHDALIQTKPIGDTLLIDACYAGLILAESQSSGPVLLVFSDGLDTFSWLSDEMIIEVAKRSNAVVYAITASQMPDKTFLHNLTKTTGGSLFEIESTRNLGNVFLGILEEFRQRYLLTYSPRGVSKSGWHVLEIRTKNRSLVIKARPGYQATTKSVDAK